MRHEIKFILKVRQINRKEEIKKGNFNFIHQLKISDSILTTKKKKKKTKKKTKKKNRNYPRNT